MGILLAIASAVSYGLSDFVGGLVSRRVSFVRVALLGQLGGLVAVLLVAPLASPDLPAARDAWWGAASGLGTGVGMTFLFRGMSRGAMSVVVPVSAVTGAALPILVGTLFLGDRPGPRTWLGVAIALPALWAVSRPSHESVPQRGGDGPALGDGLVAGVGIAAQYLALARAHRSSGLWPLATGRIAAILAVGLISVVVLRGALRPASGGERRTPARADIAGAVAAGVLAALALGCYLTATRTQLLTVAVVLSSLYPVIPVALGLTVLHERLTRARAVGLIGALLGTILIAV